MKLKIRCYIMILLFFACLNFKGQTQVQFNKYIELEGYFYNTTPYKVIFSDNKKMENLKIESSNLHWSKSEHFDTTKIAINIQFKEIGTAYLSIYDTIQNKGLKMNIRVKNLPLKFEYYLESKRYESGSMVSRSDIMSYNGWFTCSAINFDGDIRFKIKSFDMVYIYNNKTFKYVSNSAEMTSQQKKALMSLKEKTIIVFENITVEDFQGGQIQGEPFVLFLK